MLTSRLKSCSVNTGGPFTLNYIQTYSSSSNLTTYTFNSCDFGAENSTREIFVGIACGTSTSRTVSSATIGGITATVGTNSTGASALAGLVFASVPTGTTGTVSITLSGGANNMAIAIYRVTNRTASGAGETDSVQQGTAGSFSPISINALTINGNGFGFEVMATTSNRTFSSNVFTIDVFNTSLSAETAFVLFASYENPNSTSTTPTQSISWTGGGLTAYRIGAWSFDD